MDGPSRIQAAEGQLDTGLSPSLSLVKWSSRSHYIVLAFLWLTLIVLMSSRSSRSSSPAATRKASSTSTWACSAGRGGPRSTRTPRWAPIAIRRSRSTTCPTTRRPGGRYPKHLSRGLVLVNGRSSPSAVHRQANLPGRPQLRGGSGRRLVLGHGLRNRGHRHPRALRRCDAALHTRYPGGSPTSLSG